jgi:acyl-[acyl-carrier-protein]-phospholipid O-acyltransferase/long-chain-fatty-acid--[acyl-carrier-protein] ligase
MSAVATAPDPRKGERLVLLTQQKAATRSEFQTFAKSKGASDLMIPAEIVVMEKIPVLGTGKIDMVGVAQLVRDRAASAPAEAVVA